MPDENNKISLSIECYMCHKYYTIVCDYDRFMEWQNGKKKIQDALPELSPAERELLISQTCDSCWNKLWSD